MREAAVKLRCMKKINPFLWFDSEAEQAAKFYVGIFNNSKIGKITLYGEQWRGDAARESISELW